MLNGQINRIGVRNAVLIVASVAAATVIALLALTHEGSGPTVLGAAQRAATTTARGNSVASVVVGADGKVHVTGSLARSAKAAEPEPKAAAPKQAPAVQTAAPKAASALSSDVGQMIVSPVAGFAADPALLARVKSGRVGSVILFGNNISTVAQVRALVSALQAAARAGGRPPVLVMTDQEGGIVKRFRTAPPSFSAAEIGAGPSPASTALSQGQATGSALRDRGVNVDLAPVADVPTGPSFLGTRAYGSNPRAVSRVACQFAAGLRGAGVGAALKHFPGLGRAGQTNTDARAITINAGAQQLGPDLAPYRRCASGPGTMVMVSNAAYGGLTGSTPAVLSPATYRLLRQEIGFTGPVISDSLNAGALARQGNIPVRAATAGIDLLLWTSVASANVAYDQILAAVRGGGLAPSRVRAAARRVRALKSFVGAP